MITPRQLREFLVKKRKIREGHQKAVFDECSWVLRSLGVEVADCLIFKMFVTLTSYMGRLINEDSEERLALTAMEKCYIKEMDQGEEIGKLEGEFEILSERTETERNREHCQRNEEMWKERIEQAEWDLGDSRSEIKGLKEEFERGEGEVG